MANNIELTLPGKPFTTQIVTFTAPCNCDQVTDGLLINGETYTVCDAMGECVTGKGGAWCAGAQISVVLDCENKKAYIQNAASPNLKDVLNAHIDNQSNPHNVTADQVAVTENVVNAFKESGNRSVDDILTQIGGTMFGRDALYRWQKRKTDLVTSHASILAGSSASNGTTVYEPISYSTDIEIDYDTATIRLVNPTAMTLTSTKNGTFTAEDLGIKDCYFIRGGGNSSSVVYKAVDGFYVKCIDRDAGEGDDFVAMYEADTYKMVTTYASVTSTDPNAHYDGEVDADGYTYTTIDPIVTFMPRFTVGSYVGTGTYGASNPNSLTFDFVPRLVVITGIDSNNNCVSIAVMTSYGGKASNATTAQVTFLPMWVSVDGNTISYYSATSNVNQQNNASYTYHYVAIG